MLDHILRATKRLGLATVVALAALGTEAGAADWPAWRGPDRDGVSTEDGWSADALADGADIAWRAEIGVGYAAVSVADGRAYAMGHKDGKDLVHCFDAASGKKLWSDTYEAERYQRQHKGGPAATPAVDGKRLYTFSKDGQLRCYDATSGELRWAKRLPAALGVDVPRWGFSGSPLIEGKKVVLSVGPVVAMNKRSGEVLWKSEAFQAGYSSPKAFTVDGKRRIAVFNAYGPVVAREKDGTVVAKHRWKTKYDVNAATPIVLGRTNRFIFISSDYGKGCALLKLTDGGLKKAWRNREMRNHFNPCVALDLHLYGFDGDVGGAKLKCIDARTGEVQWAREGMGTGSLMIADKKLIILSENGRLILAKASPSGFQPLAQAQVLGGQCWTMPVLANGRIYCRNNDRGQLVAVDVRPSTEAE